MSATKKFLLSFRYAFRGIALCLRERNFRFHIALSAYMFGYLFVYDWFRLSRGEWAVLVLCTALVLGAEGFNTAVEAAVDLASPGLHPLAARAKDVAAGAVLLCALGAVAAGVFILWQPEAFAQLYQYYYARPGMLAVLAAALSLTAVFIWRPGRKES